MGDSFLSKNNIIFVIFILGALLSYVYFNFIQQSDRRVEVRTTLSTVERQLEDAELIRTSCATLARSRENTPSQVREQCVEGQGFVSFTRRFSRDPALSDVRRALEELGTTIEEMTGTISLHPNSTYAQDLLLKIPDQIQAVRDETEKVGKKWILF